MLWRDIRLLAGKRLLDLPVPFHDSKSMHPEKKQDLLQQLDHQLDHSAAPLKNSSCQCTRGPCADPLGQSCRILFERCSPATYRGSRPCFSARKFTPHLWPSPGERSRTTSPLRMSETNHEAKKTFQCVCACFFFWGFDVSCELRNGSLQNVCSACSQILRMAAEV